MDTKIYKGRSNVSGAIALNDGYFITADDEDNELSVFDHLTRNPADLEELNIQAAFFFPNNENQIVLLSDESEDKKSFQCVSVAL
ncbi:hypothetical protein U737_04940 [Methylomonas sp. LW13]|uniref:Uncharacterized protein n=1 Tax=Methylomonas defluvii TaxID=3045149 RepID=A0ABU4U9Z2_9GAMM|nr:MULTISPECIES: hypothetical protein [unclassified Methylomonas]MDX8126231.1 hypothetical protein [Methylomonas sp. OY6]PKD41707.1 hypothetical protein CWO84_02985 [Methylomonas sp. Kb3]QBC26317.1 hypothetical protein U737_04940 [Methylomonas sp. LW13]